MNSIFNALPIVAASYGDNMGVKVFVGGSEARTDGKNIQIPHLDVKANPDLKSVLWGYLSHESAHVKFSGFSDKYFTGLPPLGLSIQNLIEDIWIENALIQELPGTRFTMDDVADYLKRNFSPSEEDEKKPAQILFSYLYDWLYCVFREQKFLQNDLDKSRRLFDTTFPKAFVNDLEDMIRHRMPDVNSSEKANLLTRDILDLVKQHIPPEEPEKPKDQKQQQQNQSNQNDSGQPGGQSNADQKAGDGQPDEKSKKSDSGANGDEKKDTSDGSGKSQDDKKQSGQGSGSDSQPGKDKDSSNASQSGSGDQSDDSGQSQSQTVSNADSSPKNNACKEALNAGSGDLDDDMGKKLKAILEANADPEADNSALPTMSYDKNLYQMGNVDAIKDGVLHASKLRAKLTGLVQSQQLRRNYETSSGQHINTRRIDRVCSGDLRVFSHESPRKRVNSDVCLLLDSSGSMSTNRRNAICNSATASLALALGDIRGVDVCCATFPGASSSVGPINYLGKPVRKNLGRFQTQPHGGTPLPQALLWAVKELRKGKREKKIVMVLSDGEPHGGTHVKRIVSDMEKSGIQLVGVGIQTASIANYFKNHVVINNLNDLGPKLFEVARRVL